MRQSIVPSPIVFEQELLHSHTELDLQLGYSYDVTRLEVEEPAKNGVKVNTFSNTTMGLSRNKCFAPCPSRPQIWICLFLRRLY